MEMAHLLASVRPTIKNEAIPVGKLLAFSDLPRDEEKVADQCHVTRTNAVISWYWLVRNDQYVNRGHGIDITNRKTLIVPVNKISGYLTVVDSLKEGLVRHCWTLFSVWNAMNGYRLG